MTVSAEPNAVVSPEISPAHPDEPPADARVAIRVENVDVRNVSSRLANPGFSPDAIVCFQCGEAQVARYRGSTHEAHTFGSAWVFVP